MIHTPRKFGQTAKPHIARMSGEWAVCWPTNWPMPDFATTPFAPFIRRLNHVTMWRPTSFVIESHRARVQ